jgi:hypothetical protein
MERERQSTCETKHIFYKIIIQVLYVRIIGNVSGFLGLSAVEMDF